MKIIIYGHKLHTSTHSYIHSYYANAFNKLGHDVFWIDDKDGVDETFFRECMVFTEGQVDKNLPAHKSCRYVLHHCNTLKYIEVGAKVLQLGNYTATNPQFSKFKKINEFTFYDEMDGCLYQPWGTDLMPDEIDSSSVVKFNPKIKKINYIGTIWGDNRPLIDNFASEAKRNGIHFKNYSSGHIPYIYGENSINYILRKITNKVVRNFNKNRIDDRLARELAKGSLISPDIRNMHHKNVGYIPCRTFKNISYGMLPGTNSKCVNLFFENLLPYSESEAELFHKNIAECMKLDYMEKMQYLMNSVKEKHTYMSRAKQILALIS